MNIWNLVLDLLIGLGAIAVFLFFSEGRVSAFVMGAVAMISFRRVVVQFKDWHEIRRAKSGADK